MEKILLYTTLLLTTVLSMENLKSNNSVRDISWTIAARIPAGPNGKSPGFAGMISGIQEDKYIIAGGTNFPEKMPWLGGKKRYYNDIYIFDQQMKIMKVSFKLPFNLAYAAVSNTQKGIVVAGGENENGMSKKALLIRFKTGEEILQISYLPDLPVAVSNASLAVINNFVLLAGGETSGITSNQFLSLDLNHPEKGWSGLGKLPHAFSHGVLLTDNKGDGLYLVGGRKKNDNGISTIYDEVYHYNFSDNGWEKKPPLPYPLSAFSAIITPYGILVFSGDRGETFSKAEVLIAAIANEHDPEKKEQLNQKKIELQSTHPGFSLNVLKYDVQKNKWTTLKSKMPYAPVTTQAILFHGQVLIAGGEIRAGVRTDGILSGKMLEVGGNKHD